MITPRNIEVVQRVMAAYGLTAKLVFAPESGYRNRSFRIQLANLTFANLIIYKTEPGIVRRIRSANTVSNYLAAQGFPARRTLDNRILRLTSSPARYASLYHYLPGRTIPWNGYTQKHIKELGRAMGEMHTALAQLTQPTSLPNVEAEYQAICRRMATYFAQTTVQSALGSKIGLSIDLSLFSKFSRLLTYCAGLPTRQPLHMDFVRSNILFNEKAQITGILDFEKTALGSPIFDVARTLAFLRIDCNKPPAKIGKYFLHSGYAKRGGATLDHLQLLEPLITMFLTYDFYKFLRHNPYESLSQNEHYLRTRDLLLGRRVVITANRFATSAPKPL